MNAGPFWSEGVSPIKFSPLKENISADVVIIGAGIAGMSVTYMLAKSAKNVVVLDKGNVGSGETNFTTAHLVNALDDRYYDLERLHGKEGASLAAEGHTAAIDRIESIVKEENIDCDFEKVNGYLFLHPSDKKKSLKKELEASRRAGLKTEMLDRAPINSFDTGECILFPRQGQFHPMKYLAGLADAVKRMGGKIFTGTKVDEVNENGVKTSDGFRVKAKHIVVATNIPSKLLHDISLKQEQYMTYVVAGRIPKDAMEGALYWDTGNQKEKTNPYHYIRTFDLGDEWMLIAGGEDHSVNEKADKEERYRNVEAWVKERFPIEKMDYRWSGIVVEPDDSLAFIGRAPRRKNIYIVTGDSGNGLTHGTIAGILITDLILGKSNKWEKLYDPSRRTEND